MDKVDMPRMFRHYSKSTPEIQELREEHVMGLSAEPHLTINQTQQNVESCRIKS